MNELSSLIPYLTSQEQDELRRLAETALWVPDPRNKPQTEAYYSEADELLFGGQAGGGKSDLLLGLAITQHKRSIIYRRQFTQLEALIQRSKELLSRTSTAQFNGTKNAWYGIPGWKMLEFGAVQLEDDVEKYQGRPHDLVAFDELTHFTERQYVYLTGWLRTTRTDQRTRIVSGSNPPPTAEGAWVKKRWGPWLDKTHPLYGKTKDGELLWYIATEEGEERVAGPESVDRGSETLVPRSRTFIRASLQDNRFLMHDQQYLSTLQALPEPYRSMYLLGDWDAGQADDAYQVVPTAWVLAAQERWRQRKPSGFGEAEALGLDVARGGQDRTALATKSDRAITSVDQWPGTTTPDGPTAAALVAPKARPGMLVNVDVIGVGSSVYDMLKEAGGLRVRPVNYGAGSSRTDASGALQFKNVRAEAMWNVRELLDPALGAELALPDDPELLADLTAARYKVVSGRIVVESKEDIKRRLGRSPDVGDAVALALLPDRGLGMLEWLASELGEDGVE